MFMGVPTMYSYLLNAFDAMAPEQQAAARAAAGRLRLTVSGSAACPLPIMQRWEELSGLGSLSQARLTLRAWTVCLSFDYNRHCLFRASAHMAGGWCDRMPSSTHSPAMMQGLAAVTVARHAGQRLLERYGMTETNMILSNPYEGERRPGCVGLPLPGVEVRAVADPATGEDAGAHADWPWPRRGASSVTCTRSCHPESQPAC